MHWSHSNSQKKMTANKVSNAMNNNQLMDDDNLDDEFLPSPLYDSMKTPEPPS